MFEYLVRIKYIEMLKFVKRKQPTLREIAKETKFTIGWVREILQKLQRAEIIEPVFNNPDYEDRVFKITLTDKGIKLIKRINEIEKLTKEVKNDN